MDARTAVELDDMFYYVRDCMIEAAILSTIAAVIDSLDLEPKEHEEAIERILNHMRQCGRIDLNDMIVSRTEHRNQKSKGDAETARVEVNRRMEQMLKVWKLSLTREDAESNDKKEAK